MVIVALLFVWLYICLHTSSFPLGCFAMFQIILSIPLALAVYTPTLLFWGAKVLAERTKQGTGLCFSAATGLARPLARRESCFDLNGRDFDLVPHRPLVRD